MSETLSLGHALQALDTKTYHSIESLYAAISGAIVQHPTAFPRNCRPQAVFTMMQQRNWVQVNNSAVPATYTVRLVVRPQPPHLDSMNELNVMPPGTPIF